MYEPTKWENHLTEPRNRFTLKHIEGDEYEIVPCGEILNRGTLLCAENFNKQEIAVSEAVTALGCLLQSLRLFEDAFSNNVMYITDPRTITSDELEEAQTRESVYFEFPYQSKRKTANYLAIPVITGLETFTSQDESYEPKGYVALPSLVVCEKNIDKLRVDAYCGDRNSDFKSLSFVVVVIGGM